MGKHLIWTFFIEKTSHKGKTHPRVFYSLFFPHCYHDKQHHNQNTGNKIKDNTDENTNSQRNFKYTLVCGILQLIITKTLDFMGYQTFEKYFWN